MSTIAFDLFKLDGKVCVVTGGAFGIGRAIASVLVAAGAKVVIADINIEAAHEVAEELGSGSVAINFDLNSSTSITELFKQVDKSFNRLNILINNAAIYPRYPLDDVTESQWKTMQDVNVWGCFMVLREAARLMCKSGDGGRIVNISSIGGARTAVHNQVAYNASKAALDSITQSAALEYASKNILVNSILPGPVTPFTLNPKEVAHVPPSGPLLEPNRILLGRAADAYEVAGPVLMLISAAGGYITGQTLIVDGGFSIS